jgi:glucose-6-phosphate 1-dehydrogenase
MDDKVQIETLPGAPFHAERGADPCALVIFGATGDLARRKLFPGLYNLSREGLLPRECAIIGLGRNSADLPAFRALIKEAVARFSRTKLDPAAWEELAARIYYVRGDLDEPGTYVALRAELARVDREHGTRGDRLYYFSVPPSSFPVILGRLREFGLLYDHEAVAGGGPWSRVMIEKPFGRDLASARALNKMAASFLHESQIFRIDHYLGKETVQNILVFRFGNSIFEPVWNRKYIDHVQITAAEELGMEGRGKFYDAIGALRDVVQNHLLEVLALVAMEPPVSFRADDQRDERVQVLRSLRPIVGEAVARETVRAQYRGYRQEPDVAPNSRTATCAALKVSIDNWRWQGVPFYLRAGKRLARRLTEIAIHFQAVPLCLFGRDDVCQPLEPNVLTLRLQPDEGIALRFTCKTPGGDLYVSNVTMDFSYARSFDRPPQEAYERLFLDCMRGDATLFARQDGVERAWEFVNPILEGWAAADRRGEPIPEYDPGSAGPVEADALLARDGRRWRPLP